MIGHIIRLLSELKQVIYDIYEVKKNWAVKNIFIFIVEFFFIYNKLDEIYF